MSMQADYGFERETISARDGKSVNASARQRGEDILSMKSDIDELKREVLDLKQAVDMLIQDAYSKKA